MDKPSTDRQLQLRADSISRKSLTWAGSEELHITLSAKTNKLPPLPSDGSEAETFSDTIPSNQLWDQITDAESLDISSLAARDRASGLNGRASRKEGSGATLEAYLGQAQAIAPPTPRAIFQPSKSVSMEGEIDPSKDGGVKKYLTKGGNRSTFAFSKLKSQFGNVTLLNTQLLAVCIGIHSFVHPLLVLHGLACDAVL